MFFDTDVLGGVANEPQDLQWKGMGLGWDCFALWGLEDLSRDSLIVCHGFADMVGCQWWRGARHLHVFSNHALPISLFNLHASFWAWPAPDLKPLICCRQSRGGMTKEALLRAKFAPSQLQA